MSTPSPECRSAPSIAPFGGSRPGLHARGRPIVALGEALIDMVAMHNREAGSLEASTFQRAAGGAPANVAVAAARLGAPAGFIGKVGQDPFGRFLRETLASEGVDTAHLTDAPGHSTALAIVSLDPRGEREFQFYRHAAADLQLTPADVDPRYLSNAAVLHVGSLSMTAEPARGATLQALRVANEHGVITSVDPNLRLDQWPSQEAARSAILELISLATLVKVSESELEFLTGSADVSAARSLMHGRLNLVCVTRGAQGASYATRTGAGHVPGFAVEAIDSTGAGDAFMAALLVELLEAPALATNTAALERAIERANAFAALSVTRYGAIPAMPTTGELEVFLTERA